MATTPDQYLPQDVPTADDFAITASEQNSAYIQAAIATARSLYPPFDNFIDAVNFADNQLAEKILIEPIKKSDFPSFLEYASPFEIYKIYKGTAVLKARIILNLVFWGNSNYIGEKIGRGEVDELVHLVDEFFRERGYSRQYCGYLRDHTRGNIEEEDIIPPLNPTTFMENITPDQAILMEEWRKKVLSGAVSKLRTSALLGLKTMQDDFNHGIEPVPNFNLLRPEYEPHFQRIHANSRIKPHVNFHLGYNKRSLRNAIRQANKRLPRYPEAQPGYQGVMTLTRDFVMYEGENTTNEFGVDIKKWKLPLNKRMPKPYYMMIYNELAIRGYMDGIEVEDQPEDEDNEDDSEEEEDEDDEEDEGDDWWEEMILTENQIGRAEMDRRLFRRDVLDDERVQILRQNGLNPDMDYEKVEINNDRYQYIIRQLDRIIPRDNDNPLLPVLWWDQK
jgi:hypothetical protein